jgi:6-phosphogluconolactonase
LNERLVFVGTYTEPILFGTGKILQGKGEGIYAYRFDESSGSMNLCSITPAGPNPSYLTFDPSHRFLYAVNELKKYQGAQTGSVSAFSIDSESGSLSFLNRQPTHGTDPCNLVVDKTGKFVLVANFMSGSVCVLPIMKDGSLGDPTDVLQHNGSSIDPIRQAGPHAHGVTMDESGRIVFIPDLGLDKVMVYRFDPSNGILKPNDSPSIDIPAGAGPREFVMHPRGEYAYLINELNSTVMAFRYQKGYTCFERIQTISTLPQDFKGTSACGELQISPSGEYLYGANRGHDSIVTYAVNQTNGMLSYVGCTSTQGKTPRHFIVDPNGKFLLVVNQDSDNMVTFRIEPTTGELCICQNIAVPTPVCVKFL